MSPIADIIVAGLGSSIIVEIGTQAGFETTTKIVNDLVFGKAASLIIPTHSKQFETTGVKVLLITLKFKQLKDDAALGFYRSSVHQ